MCHADHPGNPHYFPRRGSADCMWRTHEPGGDGNKARISCLISGEHLRVRVAPSKAPLQPFRYFDELQQFGSVNLDPQLSPALCCILCPILSQPRRTGGVTQCAWRPLPGSQAGFVCLFIYFNYCFYFCLFVWVCGFLFVCGLGFFF